MSSSGHKRAWEAPVATTLSIRGTANAVGAGADVFLRQDFYGRPGAAPTAPLADGGARPIRCGCEAVAAPEADQRTWDAPAVTALII